MYNYNRDEPSNPLPSNSESFIYKTSITGNTYNVGVGDADYDANKAGKSEICYSSKTFKQFLDNFKYTID